MRFKLFILLAFLSDYSYSGIFPEERMDNWAILDASSKGNYGALVVGFANDGETKIVYDCNYNLKRNIKYSGLELLFPDGFPKNSSTATIAYSSDIDNSIAVSSSVFGKNIDMNNLYLWRILKKASWVSFDIDIHAGNSLIFRQNKIVFNMTKFNEALSKADKFCRFK